MKVSSAKRNAAQAEKGAWVKDVPGLPGVRFHVLGIGCTKDRDAQRAYVEALPRYQQRRGSMNEDQQRALMDARIKALLLGWDGLTEDDEVTAWPLNEQNLQTVLTDPDYDMLRQGIIFAISDVGEADAASQETDAKN